MSSPEASLKSAGPRPTTGFLNHVIKRVLVTTTKTNIISLVTRLTIKHGGAQPNNDDDDDDNDDDCGEDEQKHVVTRVIGDTTLKK